MSRPEPINLTAPSASTDAPTNAAQRPMYRSDAETAIRELLEAWLRDMHPDGRIIHELNRRRARDEGPPDLRLVRPVDRRVLGCPETPPLHPAVAVRRHPHRLSEAGGLVMAQISRFTSQIIARAALTAALSVMGKP